MGLLVLMIECRLNQFLLPGDDHSLQAAANMQLDENISQMKPHGTF